MFSLFAERADPLRIEVALLLVWLRGHGKPAEISTAGTEVLHSQIYLHCFVVSDVCSE